MPFEGLGFVSMRATTPSAPSRGWARYRWQQLAVSRVAILAEGGFSEDDVKTVTMAPRDGAADAAAVINSMRAGSRVRYDASGLELGREPLGPA